MPCTYTSGTNTTSVVSVAAVIASATSPVPTAAAVRASAPSARSRKMFSTTTMALSTSIPAPSASPPSVIRLSERCWKYITAKVTRIESGIATATTSVAGRLRRKKTSTSTARPMPTSAVSLTSPMAAWISRERSTAIFRL